MSPYSKAATEYLKSGKLPIALRAISKIPISKEWQKLKLEDYNDKLIKEFSKLDPNANIGLICGFAGGITALDIDLDATNKEDARKLNEISKIIDDDTPIKVGKKGATLFYLYNGEKAEKFRDKNGRIVIEILSDGNQTVVPPSIHPETKEAYQWVQGSIDHLEKSKLKKLNPDLVEKIKNIVGLKDKHIDEEATEIGSTVSETFSVGSRNTQLTKQAGIYVSKGFSFEEIVVLLKEKNEVLCKPPLDETEVITIAKSVSRYDTTSFKPFKYIRKLKSPPPIDDELIPESIRDWITEIAGSAKLPKNSFLVIFLSSISSVIGLQVSISPLGKMDWFAKAGLWSLLIAPPSRLKTTILSMALAPFENLCRKLRMEYEEQKIKYDKTKLKLKSDIKELNKEIKTLNTKDEAYEENLKELTKQLTEKEAALATDEPFEIRKKIQDGTTEKIQEIASKVNDTLLLLRDELQGFFKSFAKPGRDGDRQFYLESWSGVKDYRVDRILRGSLFIRDLHIVITGGIQTEVVFSIIKDIYLNKYDDGLMQRFQLIDFSENCELWEPSEKPIDELLRQNMNEMVIKISELEKSGFIFTSKEKKFKSLSVEAQKIMTSWFSKLENGEIRSRKYSHSPPFEGYIGKQRSLVPALTLIHDVLKWASTGKSQSVITPDSVNWAINYSKYLLIHAKRLWLHHDMNGYVHAMALLKWFRDNPDILKKGEFKIRDVHRMHRTGISNSVEIEKAIAFLEAHGWVSSIEKTGIGRPTEIIKINPELQKNPDSIDEVLKDLP